MCLYVMQQSEPITVELLNSEESLNGITAHVNVKESGEWVGDFYVDFEPMRDKHVADWSTIGGGNGIYVDREPTFQLVQDVADDVQEAHPDKQIDSIDSGPNDI